MRTHLAQLVARLVLAIGFLLDGIPRLSAGGHYAFSALLRDIGIPAPGVMAWLGAGVEIMLALAVLLGAYVTVAGFVMLAAMLVLLFRVHMTSGFSFAHAPGLSAQVPPFTGPAYEVIALYCAVALIVVLGGAGKLSVDAARHRTT
ncbi:MAG TPA: DoxX family protein [Gemmatimonadales bacterium]|nr:DoxX family protein [Gemmatimonadales bacterium]